MPKARKRIADSVPGASTTATATAETEREPNAEEVIAEAELESVANESTRSAYIVLFRVNRNTGEKARLAKYRAGIVDGDFVTNEWGGGKYQGQKWKPKRTGGYEYAGSQDFDIPEDVYPPKVPEWLKRQLDAEKAKNGQPVTGPVTNGAPPSGMSMLDAQMLRLFELQQQSFKESVETARADRQLQQTMLMGWLEKMARPSIEWDKVLPFAAKILFPEKKDAVEIARDLVDTMTKANARTPEPPSALADALKLIDSIENRVAKRNPGNGESTGDPWVDLVKSMAPDTLAVVKNLVEARMIEARRNAGVPVAPAAAHAAPTQPALPPAPPAYVPPQVLVPSPDPALITGPVTDPSLGTDVVLPLWAPFVKPFVPELFSYAQRGKNPEQVADLLLSRLEVEDQLNAAATLLVKPGFADEWCMAFPEFMPYRGWVTALIANAKTQLEDDGGADDEQADS